MALVRISVRSVFVGVFLKVMRAAGAVWGAENEDILLGDNSFRCEENHHDTCVQEAMEAHSHQFTTTSETVW